MNLTRRDFTFSSFTAGIAGLFGVSYPRCNTAAGEASDLLAASRSQPEAEDPAAGDGLGHDCECPRCGQMHGITTGEYPCKLCGMPTLHDDDPQPDEHFADKEPNFIDIRHMPGAPSDLYVDCLIGRLKHSLNYYREGSRTRPLSREQADEMVRHIESFYEAFRSDKAAYPRNVWGWPQSHTVSRLVKGNRVIVRLTLRYVKIELPTA